MNRNQIGIPNKETTALLVVDVQERLMPVIEESSQMIQQVNVLLRGAEILGLKTLITEQYPKGLGKTCREVILPEKFYLTEKITFSCMQCDSVLAQLRESNITDIVICGVESHICVLKTALEAIQQGFNVHVVADAVSSRTFENKELALNRMRQAGAYIVSTEMILFLLLEKAGTEEFKQISNLIK